MHVLREANAKLLRNFEMAWEIIWEIVQKLLGSVGATWLVPCLLLKCAMPKLGQIWDVGLRSIVALRSSSVFINV